MKLEDISAGVKILIGALTFLTTISAVVIWLMQLNWVALQSVDNDERQDIQIKQTSIAQQESSRNQIILTNNVENLTKIIATLAEEVKYLRKSNQTHNIESEKWKEKIRNNEHDIETFRD